MVLVIEDGEEDAVLDSLLLLVYTQVVLLPILGLLFLGIKKENDRKERLLTSTLKALRIVAVSKGRHL